MIVNRVMNLVVVQIDVSAAEERQKPSRRSGADSRIEDVGVFVRVQVGSTGSLTIDDRSVHALPWPVAIEE
jgi:hypothetical protein